MAEYDKLEKGNEFVIVHVTVENIGNQKVRINPLDFYLERGDGSIVDHTFSTRVCLKLLFIVLIEKWQRYTQRLKRRCQLIIPCCDSTEMLDFIEKHSTKWRSLYKYQSTFQGAFAFDLGGMV